MASAELAKKIVGVMTECKRVEKDGYNNFQKYKYATAASVISAVNDALTKYNIATLAESELLEKQTVQTAKGETAHLVAVKVIVTLIDADSGEERQISGIGEGYDSLDKAVAKAQTMALKYAYMNALGIAQGDDPDADNNYFEPPQNNFTTKSETKKFVGKCEDCGADVNEKSAYYSRKNFNALLCYNCQQARKSK